MSYQDEFGQVLDRFQRFWLWHWVWKSFSAGA